MTDKTYEPDNLFSANEWLRYARHIQLADVGISGQLKLKKSRALIIGLGGLGSPVALYLAAAGIGHLTLVDNDKVELSNLQRQILFKQDNLSENKSKAAANILSALNSEISVVTVDQALSTSNATSLISEADIVLDCTDNFRTRYLINDTCHALNKPWVFASIHQFAGQCSLFSPNTACMRCVFPKAPENTQNCNAGGVIGVLPGILGTLQASEAIKYLCGLETPLEGSLLLFDALKLRLEKIKLSRQSDCICCSDLALDATQLAKTYAPLYCESKPTGLELTVQDFFEKSLLATSEILDVREDNERRAFNIGGIHIPLSQLAERAIELPLDKEVICYCQSGIRSSEAASQLNGSGLKAISVRGGILEIIRHPNFSKFLSKKTEQPLKMTGPN